MYRGIKFRAVKFLLAVACGGAIFQINSCNPDVRSAVLTGLETTSTTLANILIQALFNGLGNDQPNS